MNFNEFSRELRPLIVFSKSDILKIDKKFNDENLCTWQNKEYIVKLARGYYTFADNTVDKNLLYFTCNKIIDPSYISCESALSYYNLASLEDELTSVCPIKSYTYKTDYAGFKYHRLNNPSLMFDINLVKKGHYYFKIATPEKAIVDYFFFNPQHQTKAKIAKLDFSKQIVTEKVNHNLLRQFSDAYQNQSLKTRINNFLKIFHGR